MQRQATRFALVNAKRMRGAMTDGERRLWFRLRRNRLGAKFRRQHPLGSFIADFACLDPKLVIEIDGSQHAQQTTHDTMRDEFFRRRGFVVLRFHANETLSNTEGVLEVIHDALRTFARPLPHLPPKRNGTPAAA